MFFLMLAAAPTTQACLLMRTYAYLPHTDASMPAYAHWLTQTQACLLLRTCHTQTRHASMLLAALPSLGDASSYLTGEVELHSLGGEGCKEFRALAGNFVQLYSPSHCCRSNLLAPVSPRIISSEPSFELGVVKHRAQHRLHAEQHMLRTLHCRAWHIPLDLSRSAHAISVTFETFENLVLLASRARPFGSKSIGTCDLCDFENSVLLASRAPPFGSEYCHLQSPLC